MKKSSKLQPISRIRKQHEENAGRLHGESVRQFEQCQNQLEELIQYRKDYERNFLLASKSGLSAIQMSEYRLFINRLDEAIEQQKQQVVNSQNQCQASQKAWFEKRKESKIINKVIENRQQVEKQEKEVKLQKELENQPHRFSKTSK